MRRCVSSILVGLLITAEGLATTPVEASVVALEDVKKQAEDRRLYLAYYWVGSIPKEEMETFFRVFSFHINSLSRETDLIVPVRIAEDVWRVDIRDYGWDKKTYNTLSQVDPYFHVKLQEVLIPTFAVGVRVETIRSCSACYYNNPSRIWGTVPKDMPFTVRGVKDGLLLFNTEDGELGIQSADVRIVGGSTSKRLFSSAPWLPTKTMVELVQLTDNDAPLLRADWFFIQTARQIDLRNKAVVGYYNFLGVKKEKDLEELAGISRDVVERLRRETRAIITESSVTHHNRQIARIQDGYWESLDVESNENRENAVRQLDKDYVPAAKEVYFRLPNGLWGYAAVDAKTGNLANSVPDSIASDNKSSSSDHRVHPGLSCIRCHVEGLRPLDDWSRKFYANPPGDTKLVAIEYDRAKRLKQLYLGPIFDGYDDDQRIYTRVLGRLLGWTPKELAKNYASVWQSYADTKVTGEILARELGTTHEVLLQHLAKYTTSAERGGGGSLDPVVIGFLKVPEFTARREYIEEAYILFQQALNTPVAPVKR